MSAEGNLTMNATLAVQSMEHDADNLRQMQEAHIHAARDRWELCQAQTKAILGIGERS